MSPKAPMKAIWSTIHRIFGELGASHAALSLVTHDNAENIMIVKCSNEALDMVRAAIAAVTEIDGKHAVFRVVALSGTLRGLRRKLQDTKK